MGRYLLDTHIFLWWISDSDKLKAQTYNIIANTDNQIHVSSASIWEIAIKASLGKLEIEGDVVAAIETNGFIELKISAKCAYASKELPLLHKDPFDRMLISQAIENDLTFVTIDKVIRQYEQVNLND